MTRGSLYAQAIRGPVVLMTVGALFALHQSAGISFGRTWPLIIIVFGLVKLFERMLTPAAGPYPQQPPYASYRQQPPFPQQPPYPQQPPQPPYPPSGGPRV